MLGWGLFLPDLRGTGESAASEFEQASAAWMLDRDLLNQRVWDTLRAVDHLSERYSSSQQIDKSRLAVWGVGAFGLVALVAAALDSRIAACGATDLASLESLLVPDSTVTPMAYHHAMLEHLDVSDLIGLIDATSGGGRYRARWTRVRDQRRPGGSVKIGEIRTTVVSVPQKRAYKSSWRRGYQGSAAQTSVLVEVTTDDGLTGIGEAPVVYAGRPEVTVALIDGVKDLLLGRDPFDHDIVRRQIYAETTMSHFGTQGLSWALSGIDTALWDLVGQACGQPIHRLWGSAWRTQSPFYGDIPAGDPAEMAEEAKEWVARGFRTLYFKVGFRPISTWRERARFARRWATVHDSASMPTKAGHPEVRAG